MPASRTPSPPTALAARTVAARDLPAMRGAAEAIVFDRPGLTLTGWGVAAVLTLPGGLDDATARAAARRWLAQVPVDDAVGGPGTGPVAFGALPFDRTEPGYLVVPEVVYGRDAGRRWLTVIGGPDRLDPAAAWGRLDGAAPTAAAGRNGGPGGGRPSLTDEPSPAAFVAAVAAAVAALRRGVAAKVVLSRGVTARWAAPVDLAATLGRLRANEPGCTVFSYPVLTGPGPGDDGGRFIGASPELLVERRGPSLRSVPLAGTIGLAAGPGGTDRADDLLASAKDLEEHRLVIDDMVAALGPSCAELVVPDGPSLIRLRSVAHLATELTGRLVPVDGVLPDALDLVAAVHPTPAVGGSPRQPALALIAQLEEGRRGHWGGPVGWLDAAGDGDWVVGIRSATVWRATAQLRAGVGLVPGSEPDAELAETTLKLLPVLEALAPGSGALVG
ncbi:MAG TPA: isochorismate synthase [Acidimicrobiales bacterium]|nr:isochorismate synthase [Acidimicrobiales bacterium]